MHHLAAKSSAYMKVDELSKLSSINSPTVAKIMKILAKNNLVESKRGQLGGFRIQKPAVEISIARIIEVLEGPIAMVECNASTPACGILKNCSLKPVWQKINQKVFKALSEFKLSDL